MKRQTSNVKRVTLVVERLGGQRLGHGVAYRLGIRRCYTLLKVCDVEAYSDDPTYTLNFL
jgi:hypothetical protein